MNTQAFGPAAQAVRRHEAIRMVDATSAHAVAASDSEVCDKSVGYRHEAGTPLTVRAVGGSPFALRRKGFTLCRGAHGTEYSAPLTGRVAFAPAGGTR